MKEQPRPAPSGDETSPQRTPTLAFAILAASVSGAILVSTFSDHRARFAAVQAAIAVERAQLEVEKADLAKNRAAEAQVRAALAAMR